MMIDEFHKLLINDIRRRIFEENQVRIHRCLDLISEEQLWFQHNENINSIGNLILHLCGNIRQYICAGILRETDNRDRDQEFISNQNIRIVQIREILDTTLLLIAEKLEEIEPEMLLHDYEVQGFNENGTSILIHVTEHFSYHVGQITYLTKMLNDVDTAYYGGLDLNAKSS